MNINIPISCEGDYRLVVSKDAACNTISCETGVLPNLVLNSGLDLICREGLTFRSRLDQHPSMRLLVVGSGNIEPAAGQTSLFAQIASVSLVGDGQTRGYSTNYDRGYIEVTFSRQFPQGAVVGNISEIGCGKFNNELLSRALVRDTAGNPTTITVLADEFLTVHYSLRIFFPKADITQNVNVVVDGVGVPTVITARPFGCNRAIDVNIGLMPTIGATYTQERDLSGFKSDGVMVDPSTAPVPNIHTVYGQSVAYVAGSFKRQFDISYGTDAANTGTLALLLWRSGLQPFQFLFNPTLIKNNKQTMRIRVGFQIARPT